MAKFNFPAFQAFVPVTREMKELWNSFGQTLGVLRSAFENGITVADNIHHATYAGSVENGVRVKVAHPLKRLPTHIICESGRVEFMSQVLVSATDATLLFRLLTTTGASLHDNVLTDKLWTNDAPFFVAGDAVTVDGVSNVVTQVLPGAILLKTLVRSQDSHTIVLAVENVKLLFL